MITNPITKIQVLPKKKSKYAHVLYLEHEVHEYVVHTSPDHEFTQVEETNSMYGDTGSASHNSHHSSLTCQDVLRNKCLVPSKGLKIRV